MSAMTNLHQFHDGSFDGVWIDGATAYAFLSTVNHERFVAVATRVAALRADGFKAGSIVFDVLIREADELTLDDIAELYDLREGAAGESQAKQLLLNAREQGLKLFEVDPSYGGSCMVLAGGIEVVPQNAESRIWTRISRRNS